MQPGSSTRTPAWAQIEAVFGLPFYSPRDGSSAPATRLALRLRSLGRPAVVGPRRPRDRQRTAASAAPRRRGPAARRGRSGPRLRRWVHDPRLARRRGRPRIIEEPETITIEAIDTRAQRRGAPRPRRAVRARAARPRGWREPASRGRDRSPLGAADGHGRQVAPRGTDRHGRGPELDTRARRHRGRPTSCGSRRGRRRLARASPGRSAWAPTSTCRPSRPRR